MDGLVLRLDPVPNAVAEATLAVMLLLTGWAKLRHFAAFTQAVRGHALVPGALMPAVAALVTGLELAAALLLPWQGLRGTGALLAMLPCAMAAGALAINLALASGGDPTAFALTVALSASNNFMTASNPVISRIAGPAGYSARDLWRIGGPLSLIYSFVIVVMINILF